jgi:hypothetical protein
LALSDYAQKEFDAPPARWRGYSRMTSETLLVPLQIRGVDTFADAGIEGLFANIGFSGLWDLRFALGACGQTGGEGQIGCIGKRRGEMPARVIARPVPSIGTGNERQW